MPEITSLEPAAEIQTRRLLAKVVIRPTLARAGIGAPPSTLANVIRRIKAGCCRSMDRRRPVDRSRNAGW